MRPTNLTLATIGSVLLATVLTAPADEAVITQGVDVDVRQYIDESPQGPSPDLGQNVQDLGDGTTNEGGAPDGYFDLRDEALEDEKNLGPNAPGYIP